MDIFLIRHGEMEFEKDAEMDLELVNAYAMGTKEGPLTPKGVNQARLAAGFLAPEKVHALYSSEFIRAKQTAEETSKITGIPVTVLKDIGELNVGRLIPDRNPVQAGVLRGIWNLHRALPYVLGKTMTKRVLGYFFILYYFRNWYAGKTVEGESVDEAIKRIQNVFEEMTERHGPREKVAVFTHGYFIHLLVNHILDPRGAPLRMVGTPYIQNGSVTHLSRTGGGRWKVKAYAATRHFRGPPP